MDIKIKNNKINPFCELQEALNTDIIVFIFIFVENCLKCKTIHEFSVWFRNGSNPEDTNEFLRHIVILLLIKLSTFV